MSWYKNFFGQVARGLVGTDQGLPVFARAPNGVQTTATDIWDRADNTPTQQIWLPPTQARIHNIVSTSANDTAGGTHAQRIIIYGLVDWNTAETSEIVTLNGLTIVPTANEYVIINRMEVIIFGTSGTNEGIVTATAVTDGTVSAQINARKGHTLMAVTGIPQNKTALMGRLYGAIRASGGANTSVQMSLLVNPSVNTQTGFNVRHEFGLIKVGTSAISIGFYVPKPIKGPAIIKLQGVSTDADTDVTGGFDLIVTDS